MRTPRSYFRAVPFIEARNGIESQARPSPHGPSITPLTKQCNFCPTSYTARTIRAFFALLLSCWINREQLCYFLSFKEHFLRQNATNFPHSRSMCIVLGTPPPPAPPPRGGIYPSRPLCARRLRKVRHPLTLVLRLLYTLQSDALKYIYIRFVLLSSPSPCHDDAQCLALCPSLSSRFAAPWQKPSFPSIS